MQNAMNRMQCTCIGKANLDEEYDNFLIATLLKVDNDIVSVVSMQH